MGKEEGRFVRTRSKVQKRGAGRRMVEVMGREGERVRREVRGRVEAPAREPVRRKVSWRWRGGIVRSWGGWEEWEDMVEL